MTQNGNHTHVLTATTVMNIRTMAEVSATVPYPMPTCCPQ